MKKTVCMLGILALAMGFQALEPDFANAKTTLKLAHVCTLEDVFHLQAVKFKQLVEQKTGGGIEIKLFPNKQLGEKETDLISMVQQGVVDSAVITCGPITTFDPLFGVQDLPFLYVSKENACKVLDGPIGQRFLDSLGKIGIKGLAFGERGVRNVSNNVHPINSPDDLKGIKIRVMETPIYVSTFKALGANPVPMGWGEVYTALQQGVIDAQENPPWVIWAFKIFEVQKYYSLTGHSYAGNVVMMNKKLFEAFPLQTQKILVECAREASVYERKVNTEGVVDVLKKLKDKGMIINDVNRKPFQEKCASVYEEVFKKNPDWRSVVAEIQAVK